VSIPYGYAAGGKTVRSGLIIADFAAEMARLALLDRRELPGGVAAIPLADSE
jgi:hypothetical protein